MASTPDNLYVTYVDIDRDLLKIWGQRNRVGATYIERQLQQLQQEFNKTGGPNPNRIHKGMFCFAKYEGNYYRARVVSRVQDDSVGVLFVDYGNRDLIKLSNIRIQEGNEGDVLAKMCEQADEYYLAKVAAPPLGWTKEIIGEIRRDVCYNEFRYQIITQIGDQKILDIEFRGDDFSNYLVEKKLATPLSIPVQRQLILTYCRLVPEEVKPEQSFRDTSRVAFSPSVPPPNVGMRVPLKPANAANDTNMQLNYVKANTGGNYPSPVPPMHYPPPRHMKAPYHQMEQNIPKNSYYSPVSNVNNQMPVDPVPLQSQGSMNPMMNQFNQFYQMPDGGAQYLNRNNSNIIEILAQQVKQYIAKDNAKSGNEEEKIPHHYVNSVLEVGNTYKVVVSFVDDGPWSFSIQLMSSESELKKLTEELSLSDLVPIKTPIIVGHPCIGRRALDENLCRGVIVKICRTALKVYFVDYGNIEDLPSSSVYEFPPKFFKTEVLSQKFSLSGLKNVAYSEDIKKFFKEIVESEDLLLRVVSLEDDNLPACELFVQGKNIKRILNEKMRELKSSVVDDFPKIGDTENVLVTWVLSPQKFFIQLCKREGDLKALKKELAEVETKGQKIPFNQLYDGLRCVCLYESDGNWYRAVITSVVSESAITVFYVDYGNTETVHLSHLRKVEDSGSIGLMVDQAIQCCLKGFENQPFDQLLTAKLESLTLENEFQISVVSVENKVLCVNLYDNGNDIASLLLLNQPQTQAQPLMQIQTQMPEPKQTQMQIQTQTQPKITERQIFTRSESNVWNSSEAPKSTFQNKTEKDNKYKFEEFGERRPRNFLVEQNRWKIQGSRPGQNFQKIQSPVRANQTHLMNRFDKRENWRAENPSYQDKDVGSDQQKNWRALGTRNWDHNKPAGYRGPPRGQEESNIPGERSERFHVNKHRNTRDERKGTNYGENKFVDNRGKRFDGERKPNFKEGRRFVNNGDLGKGGFDDSKKKFDKFEDKKSSGIPIKNEDAAPPGTKFEEKRVNIGSCEKGIVTYYFSPDEFFVQLLAEEEDFKKMMKDIQSYYSDKCYVKEPVKAGDIVIAQFSYDKILYRAEVIKPSPVTVRYVDYGNQEPVQPKEIWLVDKKFLKLPQQVVKCRLSGLQPAGSDWPPPGSAVDKFFEFAEYKCTFLAKEGDMYEVAMEAVGNGKDITSEIIAAGLGRKIDPKLDIPETDYSLLENQILRLYISHVDSSSNFYVVIDQKASKLIEEAIAADDKKNLSPIDLSSVQPETVCLVKTDENLWYRGNILKTDGKTATVWLSDTGNKVEVAKDKVMKLPDYLQNVQPQAVECCLKISNLENEESFKKTVEHKNYLVHIISVADKRLSVILYDDNGRILDFEGNCNVAKSIEPIAPLPITTQRIPLSILQIDSPKEVYIRRTADKDNLDTIVKQMNQFYAGEGEDFPEKDIPEGTLVAAKSNIFQSWCRGRITSSSDDNLGVFYIDHGRKEILPRENLKKLDSSFLETTALCRKLSFDVDFPAEKVVEINRKILEMCGERDLFGYFKIKDGELFLEVTSNDKSVTEFLKLSGLISTNGSSRFVETESNASVSSETVEQQSDDSEFRVFVSHIDCPNRFWVHKESLINDLQQLQEKLRKICEESSGKKDVKVGEIVATMFSGLWYRARVTGVEEEMATVQFIDYGNTSVVDFNAEMVIDLKGSGLIEVPVLATRCSLKGTWNDNATSKFEEIILRNEDPVRLVVLEQGDPVVVDLFQNERSIAEMLLDECRRGDVTSEVEEDSDLCTVYITYSSSPREFYIQRETCTATLNELSERLFDASDFEDPVSIEENKLYAAKYPEDGAWYRGKVIGKSENDIIVHFVDFGNKSIVSEIKTLPDDLTEIPYLSEKCCLAYGNNCDSWSDAACKSFAEYADGRALQMKVISTGDKKTVVRLYHDGEDISEKLGALCEKNERVDMYMSHVVSPTEFYMQYVDDEEFKMIGEILSNEDNCEVLKDRTKDTTCQACFSEDGCWYRAKIVQDLGDEGCEVFFIDFGNISVSKELKELPEEIKNISPRAFKCSLNFRDRIVTENMTNDFINLTAAESAVFQGRILTPGETNIISLKIDGLILEEVIIDDNDTNSKSESENNKENENPKEEETGEAETSIEDISFEKRTTEETVPKKIEVDSAANETNDDGFEDANPGVKMPESSVSRGEKEENIDEKAKEV